MNQLIEYQFEINPNYSYITDYKNPSFEFLEEQYILESSRIKDHQSILINIVEYICLYGSFNSDCLEFLDKAEFDYNSIGLYDGFYTLSQYAYAHKNLFLIKHLCL